MENTSGIKEKIAVTQQKDDATIRLEWKPRFMVERKKCEFLRKIFILDMV